MDQSVTKEKLLEAGKKVIYTKGYQRTRVSDITKEANLGHGTFYLYFSSKKDILIELASITINQIVSDIDKGIELVREGKIEEGKKILLFEPIKTAIKNRELAKIFYFEAMCGDEDFQEFYKTSKRLMLKKAKETLETLNIPNPEIKAHILIGLSRHLIEILILENEDVYEIWCSALKELNTL